MINKAIIVGNLGRDPEIRYTPDGVAVANFSVATTKRWKDRNTGQQQEKTEWHRIVAFRRLAEICGEYLAKGRQVYIEGELQTRQYEKDGVTHYITEIVANEMKMLGSRGGSDTGRYSQGGGQGYQGGRQASPQGSPQGGYSGGQQGGPSGGGYGGGGSNNFSDSSGPMPGPGGPDYGGPPDDDIPF